MTENHHNGHSEEYVTLLLLAAACRKAVQRLDEAAQSGEEIELRTIMEEAITESALNHADLVRLWAASLLMAQIAKRIYVVSVEGQVPTGPIDAGEWETIP
jgi:hypothetical protein